MRILDRDHFSSLAVPLPIDIRAIAIPPSDTTYVVARPWPVQLYAEPTAEGKWVNRSLYTPLRPWLC